MRRALAAVIVGLVAAGSACGGGARARAPGGARVTKVVDGDTLRASINGREERVRLIGIDTPETQKPDTARECFGREASGALASLVPPGTEITLVRDVEARDRYDRLLAYVYRSRDQLFVNLEMARHGFAAAYTYPPNVAHAADFVQAAAEAREHQRGLWAACGGAHEPVRSAMHEHARRDAGPPT